MHHFSIRDFPPFFLTLPFPLPFMWDGGGVRRRSVWVSFSYIDKYGEPSGVFRSGLFQSRPTRTCAHTDHHLNEGGKTRLEEGGGLSHRDLRRTTERIHFLVGFVLFFLHLFSYYEAGSRKRKKSMG